MNFLRNDLQIKFSSSRKLPFGRRFPCVTRAGKKDNALIVLLEDFLQTSAFGFSLYATSLWIREESHREEWVTEGSGEERKERMSVLASWPLSIRSLLSSNSSDYKLSWYLKWPYPTPPSPPLLLSSIHPPPPIHFRLVWAVCACVTMSTTWI